VFDDPDLGLHRVPRFAVIIIELKHSAGSFWQFRKPSAHKLWESDLHRLAIPRQGFGMSCRLANGAYTFWRNIGFLDLFMAGPRTRH